MAGGGNKSVVNPAQAHHKQQRKKQLAKHKEQRLKERNKKLLSTKTISQVQQEIKELGKPKASWSHAQTCKLQRLEKELKLLQEHQVKQRQEQASNNTLYQPPKVVEKQKSPLDLLHEQVDPRASVYYDARLNPYGAPPPGRPRLYHAANGKSTTMDPHLAVVPPHLLQQAIKQNHQVQDESTEFLQQIPERNVPLTNAATTTTTRKHQEDHRHDAAAPMANFAMPESRKRLRRHAKQGMEDIWASSQDMQDDGDVDGTATMGQALPPKKKKKQKKPPLAFFYQDQQGQTQGPFSKEHMLAWKAAGYFPPNTLIKTTRDDTLKVWTAIPSLQPQETKRQDRESSDADRIAALKGEQESSVADRIAALKGETESSVADRIAALKGERESSVADRIAALKGEQQSSVADRIAALKGEQESTVADRIAALKGSSVQDRIAALKGDQDTSSQDRIESPNDDQEPSLQDRLDALKGGQELSVEDRIAALKDAQESSVQDRIAALKHQESEESEDGIAGVERMQESTVQDPIATSMVHKGATSPSPPKDEAPAPPARPSFLSDYSLSDESDDDEPLPPKAKPSEKDLPLPPPPPPAGPSMAPDYAYPVDENVGPAMPPESYPVDDEEDGMVGPAMQPDYPIDEDDMVGPSLPAEGDVPPPPASKPQVKDTDLAYSYPAIDDGQGEDNMYAYPVDAVAPYPTDVDYPATDEYPVTDAYPMEQEESIPNSTTEPEPKKQVEIKNPAVLSFVPSQLHSKKKRKAQSSAGKSHPVLRQTSQHEPKKVDPMSQFLEEIDNLG